MNNMIELHEIYSCPYVEGDEYHTILADMKFLFSYTKHARDEVSSGGRFTVRHNTLRKLRDFFSCHRANRQGNGKVNEDQEALIEKVLHGSKAEDSHKASRLDGVSATQMNEHEKSEKKQEQHKMASFTARECMENEEAKVKSTGKGNLRKENWHYQQFHDDEETSRAINNEDAIPTPPLKSTLKRKRGAGDIRANKAGFGAYMKHLRAQQCAIREGKLEQVVQPGHFPPRNTITNAPPPPKSQSPIPRSLSRRYKDKSSTSKIAPSKLTSYMTSSADLLDATRRDLASNLIKSVEKLRPPLAGLDFHYVGILRRGNATDDDDDDDDQSFSCIGISETELRVGTPELEKARRISGDGLDPWTQRRGSITECRMCCAHCPWMGSKGLCRQCERAFQRSLKTFNRRNEDEVKPPVPLKTTRPRAEYPMSSLREELHPSPTSSNDSERFINHSASRTSAELGRAPSIASQHGKIGRIEVNSHTPQRRTEFISIYERWQTPEMRAELAKREALRRSSRLVGTDDTPTTRKEEVISAKYI